MIGLRRVTLLACALSVVAATALPATSSAAGRITGGTKVDRGEYDSRWQAIVSIREAVTGEAVLGDDRPGWLDSHECGGVLVQPDIVVTAAHCVDGGSWNRMLGGHLKVLAGSRVLREDVNKQPGQLVDVVDVRVHPSWDGTMAYFDEGAPEGWDVAVLKLAQPVTGIQPMRLIGADERALWGGGSGLRPGAWVAGWGVTNALYDRVDIDEADETQANLREVQLPLLSDSTCERSDLSMGSDAEAFDREKMICGFARDTDRRANRSNRRGTCYGDSGGPMAVPGADGTPRLIGIVSWGPATGGGCQGPSVFTRVDTSRDWINGAIADLGAPATLTVGAPTSGEVVGADSVRLRWAAASGTPVRYTVVREVPLISAAELDAYRDEDAPLLPAVRRFLLRQRVLVPMASTGAESREVFVRGVAPRRAGQRKVQRFRLEVRDSDGRMARGESLAIDAPVDAKAPGRPRVGPAGRRFAWIVEGDSPRPSIQWRAVTDNDCVEEYVIEVASSRGWRRVDTVHGQDCPSSNDPWDAFDGYDDDDESAIGATFIATVPHVSGGMHTVRVGAVDRAGNRSWGAPTRVVVFPTAGYTHCTARSDGGGCSSGGVTRVSGGTSGAFVQG
jgi:secreted trypsin-like serine protease